MSASASRLRVASYVPIAKALTVGLEQAAANLARAMRDVEAARPSLADLQCRMDAAFGRPTSAPELPGDRDGLKRMLTRATLPRSPTSHKETRHGRAP